MDTGSKEESEDFKIDDEDSDDDEDYAEDEELSEDGKRMERKKRGAVLEEEEDDDEDEDDESSSGEASMEQRFKTKRLAEDISGEDEAHDLGSDDDCEEDDEGPDIADPFSDGDAPLTHLRMGVNGFIYSQLLRAVFPEYDQMLQGGFSLVPEEFVDQAKTQADAGLAFYKEHEEFMKTVKTAMLSQCMEQQPIFYAFADKLAKSKRFSCVQIAAIFEDTSIPPMIRKCALTRKTLCAEDDVRGQSPLKPPVSEEAKGSGESEGCVNKSPGWMLIVEHDADADSWTLPVSKVMALLLVSYHYMCNMRNIVRASIAARLVEIWDASPNQTHFKVVNTFITDPLNNAAKMYWQYFCAKQHLCDILKIAKSEKDAAIVGE